MERRIVQNKSTVNIETNNKRKSQKNKSRYKKKDVIAAYLFIAPLVIGIVIFYILPMFKSLFYSFTEWGKFGGWTFIGLENFKRLLTDPELFGAIKNTFKYALMVVPISISISVLIATLLNSKIKGVGIYRTLYFLPAITMTSAVAMIWKWMFNLDYGVINQILSKFGVGEIHWLTSPKIAIFTLVIIGVWSSMGTSIVIFLAGLQGIPRRYYEAAEIDGAGTFRKFFSITIPLLSPTVFFSLVTSLIGSLQVYDLIYMMFSTTNPALEGVQSLAYLFYKNGFMMNNKGYASAIAIVLLCITLTITAINFKMQKKWVHYD